MVSGLHRKCHTLNFILSMFFGFSLGLLPHFMKVYCKWPPIHLSTVSVGGARGRFSCFHLCFLIDQFALLYVFKVFLRNVKNACESDDVIKYRTGVVAANFEDFPVSIEA